jgi:hypothetical protein
MAIPKARIDCSALIRRLNRQLEPSGRLGQTWILNVSPVSMIVSNLLNIIPASTTEDYIKPAMPTIRARDLHSDPVWPFQADILAIVRCGWPVRLCEWCGEPILVFRPNVRFCQGSGPKSCYVEHCRDTKKRAWHRRKHVYRGKAKRAHLRGDNCGTGVSDKAGYWSESWSEGPSVARSTSESRYTPQPELAEQPESSDRS